MMSARPTGLARRTLDGLFWSALSSGSLAVAEIVALVILARLLSPEAFGLYAATLMIMRASAMMSGLGIAPAIVQRPELEERHIRTAITLALLLSVSVTALLWAAAPAIASLLRLEGLAQIVRATCFILLIQGLTQVSVALAQRALRFRWLAAVDALAFVGGFLFVGPALAALGAGVWSLVGAYVAQHVLRAAIMLAHERHPRRPMADWRAAVELLYYGSGDTVARVASYAANQAHKLVVGRWLGAGALGLYALSTQLTFTPAAIIAKLLDRVLFPTMALVQLEPKRLKRAYRSALAACALLVLPAGVVIAILSDELVLVILGDGWREAAGPLQVLALGMFFRTSYNVSDSVARASAAVFSRAWRHTVFALCVVAGSLIGQLWGLQGVAIGVVVAVMANFVLMAELSLRIAGMTRLEFVLVHLPALALTGVVGASVWTLAAYLRATDAPALSILLECIALAAGEALLLWWMMPAWFLGAEGRSLVQVLAGLSRRSAKPPLSP